MAKCFKLCNIVMSVLLLGSISAKLPFVPVNRKSLVKYIEIG